MSQAAATVEQAAPAASTTSTTPDRYDLHGKRISISYIPEAVIGPIPTDGPVRFVYQDDVQTLKFTADDIRAVDVPDLGTVVSVNIGKTIDTGPVGGRVHLRQPAPPSQRMTSEEVPGLGGLSGAAKRWCPRPGTRVSRPSVGMSDRISEQLLFGTIQPPGQIARRNNVHNASCETTPAV